MPAYSYRGVSATGRSVAGVIEADSTRSARAQLRERGIFASEVHTGQSVSTARTSRPWLRRRVGVRELSRTLRQLATLLAAGMPLVDAVGSIAEAKERLKGERYDLCLTDMRLGDGEGLELVRHIAGLAVDLPVAVITAYGSADNAVAALK